MLPPPASQNSSVSSARRARTQYVTQQIWFQHSFYRDSSTATHSSRSARPQGHECSGSSRQELLHDMRNHKPALKQIGCRLSRESCLFMHHIHIGPTCQTVYDVIHSFCSQWQIPSEVNWLGLPVRSAEYKN